MFFVLTETGKEQSLAEDDSQADLYPDLQPGPSTDTKPGSFAEPQSGPSTDVEPGSYKRKRRTMK